MKLIFSTCFAFFVFITSTQTCNDVFLQLLAILFNNCMCCFTFSCMSTSTMSYNLTFMSRNGNLPYEHEFVHFFSQYAPHSIPNNPTLFIFTVNLFVPNSLHIRLSYDRAYHEITANQNSLTLPVIHRQMCRRPELVPEATMGYVG